MEPDKRFPLPLVGALALILALGIWWTLGNREQAAASAPGEAEQVDDPRSKERKPIKPVLGEKVALDAEPRAAISGTIRDEKDQPIAGARVCATPDTAELEGHDPGFPVCTKSGKDGRYAIDGLWPVPTRVDASAKAYVPNQWAEKITGSKERRQVRLRAGETSTAIDIVLRSGGVRIEGVVKDIAGGGIEGAYVSAGRSFRWRSGRGAAVVKTDADGAFEAWVAPGNVRILARADGYAPGSTQAVAPGEFIEAFLTPESVLVGEVVHAETGKVVPGILVHASRGGFGGGGTSARTNDAGVFRIGGLEPGAYKPAVSEQGLYGMSDEQVHLGLGQTSEVVTVRAHPVAEARGVLLVAGRDEGCVDGGVTFSNKENKNEQRWGRVKEEGKITVTGLLPGTYAVSAYCDGFVAREDYPDVEIGAESVEGLRWEVDAGLSVAGEVLDADGSPVEGLTVSARQVLEEGEERGQMNWGWATSDAEGRFELTGLKVGNYELEAGSSWSGRPGLEDPIELSLEESVDDLLIELPSMGKLHGKVTDARGKPLSGAQVTARLLDGEGWVRARTNDEGQFTMDDVRPGATRVTASSESWGAAMRAPGTSDDDLQGERVEIAAGEDLEVNLVVARSDGAIRGKVVDEQGPVVDAFVSAERISEKAGASKASARHASRWSWNEQPVLTEQDGSFTLEGLEEGNYVVRAYRKGGGEGLVEDVAVDTSVTVTIQTTGELAGTVLAGDEAPERFRISAQDKVNGTSRFDSYFRTGGKWRLTEVPPGTYEISATSSEGTAKLEAITIGEGESREDLVLTLSGRVTVKGRLVDADTSKPIRGLQVSISPRSGGFFVRDGGDKDREMVSGADGTFTVEDAPVGKVRIMAWDRAGGKDSKYQWTMLSRELPSEPAVQDIGDVKLIASRLEPNQKAGDLGFTLHEEEPTVEDEDRQMKVALVREDGPAADSGLEAGHVITMVDGKPVGGADYASWWRLTSVPPGTKLTLTVEDVETPIFVTVGPPR